MKEERFGGVNIAKEQRAKILRVLGVVGMVLGIVAIVLGLVFFFSGAKIVERGYKVSTFKEVCTEKDIDRYNDLQIINSGMPTSDVVAFYNEIIKKEGFEQDPNCVYLATRHNIAVQNATEAEKYLKLLEGLNADEKWAIMKFRDAVGTDTLRFYIEAIKQASMTDGGSVVSGGGGGTVTESKPAPTPAPASELQPTPAPAQ